MSTDVLENRVYPNLPTQNFYSNIELQDYDLRKERDRLRTFHDNNWRNEFVNAEDLAILGFYFFKNPDEVKCTFCYISIKEFEEGDDVLTEHIKWCPNCPLIRRRRTDNVPIDASKLDQILPPASYDVCGFTKTRSQRSKIDEKIKHPDYKLINQRIKSFELWPIGIKQKPLELAEAGFFYSGQSDITICFSCDLNLSRWEPEDNAWLEHKKHATEDCDFLRLNHETVKFNEENYEKVKKPQKIEVVDDGSSESPSNETQFESLCKICLERKSSVLFLPCKHVAVCGQCVFGIEKDCPICRTPIDQTINVFYA